MRKLNFLFISVLALLFSCSKEDKKAVELIQKSIEAHGGQKTWDSAEELSFQKQTSLFLENGDEESESTQQISFRLKPYFEAKISYEKDGLVHRIYFDGANTKYHMGENEIKNEGFLQSKKKEIDAAFYVINKPFDLLTGAKLVTYQGLQTLPDGSEVETIQVIDGDPNDPKTDIWWYYFDLETFLIVAYKTKTSDHFSLVYNLSWDQRSAMVFPATRESYRVDSLGNHLYLRAKYHYSDFQISK
ncbi:hypothetical protein [Mongoliibacter ruber]|uniref:Outer membrane lipoprotein-sorting protein n=1 Tax=Mongoliibacter ruber TaxID=1750599 RepID=A0A2T0WN24_9BACT|nr:hypothetical protein [Mongoliibacter ruber]PRY88108.1 hypothetical protein CLW00_105229 [Mongoliibacter ruber]